MVLQQKLLSLQKDELVVKKLNNFLNSQTAVSEAIGFILTLGVVILASGLVYANGLPILQQSMDTSHFMEMQESFSLLGQNINEVAYERAPVRNTELKIIGGAMSIRHDSLMQINVNGSINTFELGSVEYFLDHQITAYENGAVWTKYRNNDTVIVVKPHINYANVTTIPVIELLGTHTKAGEGSARIRAQRSDSSTIYFINATGHNSTITVQSTFYKGWERYFEDNLGADNIVVDNTNRTVSGNITTDYIYIDFNRLNMEIY
ncbi:MAG: hypothetical protein SCH39_12260 [Methanosarcinales archaeon]|nr:hypothetical protein [Methanosarcinales archaeon]